MGVPHEIVNRENVVLSRQEAVILGCSLGFTDQSSLEKIGTSLEGSQIKMAWIRSILPARS